MRSTFRHYINLVTKLRYTTHIPLSNSSITGSGNARRLQLKRRSAHKLKNLEQKKGKGRADSRHSSMIVPRNPQIQEDEEI